MITWRFFTVNSEVSLCWVLPVRWSGTGSESGCTPSAPQWWIYGRLPAEHTEHRLFFISCFILKYRFSKKQIVTWILLFQMIVSCCKNTVLCCLIFIFIIISEEVKLFASESKPVRKTEKWFDLNKPVLDIFCPKVFHSNLFNNMVMILNCGFETRSQNRDL